MKSVSRFRSAVLIGGSLLLAWCVFMYALAHGFPTIADARQSYNLRCFVTSQLAFEGKSAMDSNKPPVYCSARRNSAVLSVYGVTNAARQDVVLEAVREWQTTNQNMPRLTVRFYERENWRHITNHDGIASMRLPEVLLRQESVVWSKKRLPNN